MFSIIVSTPSGSFKADRLYLFLYFSVMSEENFDPKKCVICLKSFLSSEKVVVGSKGLNTLLHYCKLRECPDLESHISKCTEQNVEVLVHKDCRRKFTDMKRKFTFHADKASSSNAPSKRLRSSMEPFSWKDNCFFLWTGS